ncbi:O-antigen ligase family protein [Collimonas sp.]|jgi:putative inorganic carbon (HCO3(-)) transporter|uniref:O-antigen ligase family protein n=1 Tax=Collimonas sp. TaxID=1963772 RepID=UPI002C632922|nr:O-antigen ligase family protein [Collimonas sp.]HWX03378.1 O-antigen ligase family protein [Collimonas sp.]
MLGIFRTTVFPVLNAVSAASARLQQPLVILVVILAVVGPLWPFAFINGTGFHDNQRILEIISIGMALLFSLAFLVRASHSRILPMYERRAVFFLTLFFSLGLVSSAVAYSPRHALFEWANFLSLGITSMLIASEMRTKGDGLLDKVLLLCGIGSALYILLEIVVYLAMINAGGQPANEMLIAGFGNYRFFNHVQTVTLPLLGLLAARSGTGKKKIFSWIVMSAWWALLFLTAGRGTFFGILAGMGVTVMCLRKASLPWCKVMLYSALLGFSVYLLFYVLIPISLGLQPFGFLFSVVGRTMANPDSSRLPLWIRAWEMIAAHPWLGAGPMHFAHFGRSVQNGAHPHNWMLQIASEWGIPALLCLVAALVLGFRKLLAARRYPELKDGKNQLILAAWLTTGVAILVDGLVSGLFVMPSSQLWIALYIGCAWGWLCSVAPSTVATTMRLSAVMRVGGVISVTVLIYFLGHGVWPEIRNLPFYEEQSLQKELYPNPAYHPRIWLGGYF